MNSKRETKVFSFWWDSIQAGVVFFQLQFSTWVLLVFSRGGFVFKSGVALKRIQYTHQACGRVRKSMKKNKFENKNEHAVSSYAAG